MTEYFLYHIYNFIHVYNIIFHVLYLYKYHALLNRNILLNDIANRPNKILIATGENG